MAQTVEFADTLGKHTQFADGSIRVERIITDIPSFPGRFSGSGNSGGVIDCVNSVIHLIKNSLTEDGTATIGCTGIALDKFNSWLGSQSDYEVVPGSEFTTTNHYLEIQLAINNYGQEHQNGLTSELLEKLDQVLQYHGLIMKQLKE